MSKPLSINAQKLLERIKAGKYYRAYDPKLPAAMAELEAAKLVTTTGRVVTIELCYVPATGYAPYQEEKFTP